MDDLQELLAKLNAPETPEQKAAREKAIKEHEEQERNYELEQNKHAIEIKFGMRYIDCCFDNFICSNEKQKKIKKLCQDYASMDKKKGESLLMYGKSGTGKNHLLVAMFRENIRYLEVAKLEQMNAEKMELQKKGKNWMAGLQKYCTTWMLIIPDLVVRKEGLSDSLKELLLHIIDERYNNYRPVVICTNVSIPEMKKAIDFDGTERVSDRLKEMIGNRVMCLDWESYREK